MKLGGKGHLPQTTNQAKPPIRAYLTKVEFHRTKQSNIFMPLDVILFLASDLKKPACATQVSPAAPVPPPLRPRRLNATGSRGMWEPWDLRETKSNMFKEMSIWRNTEMSENAGENPRSSYA